MLTGEVMLELLWTSIFADNIVMCSESEEHWRNPGEVEVCSEDKINECQ